MYRTTSEIADRTFDYIVCANKVVADPASIPPLFRDITTEETTFVIAQNGIGNEEYFRSEYPNNTILSCVLWIAAFQQSPTLIKHMTQEYTDLGLHRNAALPAELEVKRLNAFFALLERGGTNVAIQDDIQLKRWEKVTWNIAWSPITMLTRVDTIDWLSKPEAVTMTRRLFDEVISIGIAAGVQLRHELTDELMARIEAMGGLRSTSMAVDAQVGRPLEMEVILGVPLRKARELGVDVPTLSALFALTEAIHNRIVNTQQS